MECKICNNNKVYKSLSGLSIHLRNHKIKLSEYLINYNTDMIPICKCGEKVSIANSNRFFFNKTCGNKNCIRDRIHTPESKEKIRKARFNYLDKKTGKTAWERRAAGQMSYLEQWFYYDVILKYNLLKTYDIVNEYPFYPYFIDFAFLNIKLAVELDGACHFNNGDERFDHDVKKDNKLIENGWKVFRISYKNNNQNMIETFLNDLKNIENIEEKLLGDILCKGNIKKIKHKRTFNEYWEDYRNNVIEKNSNKIEEIKNSNIDFSKFGWSKHVAKIVGITSSKSCSWMRKYMPEFYEEKCYKKK